MTKTDAKLRFVEANTPKAFFDLIKETYDLIEKESRKAETPDDEGSGRGGR